MGNGDNREEFLADVRRALGRDGPLDDLDVPRATGLSDDRDAVFQRVEAIRLDSESRVDQLVDELLSSAEEAGWIVKQTGPAEAADYVRLVAEDVGATSVLRSDHKVLDDISLDAAFEGLSIGTKKIAYEESPVQRSQQRIEFRQEMIVADLGVTGVDYAIAETGSVAITAGKGVSRLISLLPPVHVAVVRPSQILPSLDELFTIRRNDFLETGSLDYANIISGPSRSADIEQTLIKGMHGPREVHMIVLA